MKYAVRALFIFFLLSLIFVFSVGKDAIQINRQGDAALFEQITQNVYYGKGMVSNVFASTQNYIDREYYKQPIIELLASDLQGPVNSERDMSEFHAYYIFYFIAPFLFFFQASLLLTFVQVASAIALLGIIFYLVYDGTKSYFYSLMVVGVIFLSPPWIGNLYGQFYPDRMFFLFAPLLSALIYFRKNKWLVLTAALLSASCNERAALMSALILLFVPFSSKRDDAFLRDYAQYVFLALLLLVYAYVFKTFVLSNQYYGSFLPESLDALQARFEADVFRSKAFEMLFVLFPLLFLSLFSPPLFLLALVAFFPNFVGDVGGAEKIGWLTHYHSYYFPILCFSAAVGAVRLFRSRIIGHGFFASKLTYFVVAILLCLAAAAFHSQMQNGKLLPYDGLTQPIKVFNHFRKNQDTNYKIQDDLTSMLDLRAGSVLTDELGAALLHRYVDIDIFPVITSRTAYLFTGCGEIDLALSGQNAPLFEWLIRNRFDLQNIQRYMPINRCLLKRNVSLP